MTKPVDLCLFLKDWLAWATSGDTEAPSPEGVFYDDCYGLCRSALEYSGCTGRDLPSGYGDPKVLQAWLGFTGPYPFGKDNYDARILADSQHLDPARLEWVRNKIAKLENVPEEPKPVTTLNGQPTGRDQELEDMRAINIALQAEIDDLKKYDVRQVVIGRVPGIARPIFPIFARDIDEVENTINTLAVKLFGRDRAYIPEKCDHQFFPYGDQGRRRCKICATLELLPVAPGPAVELPDHHLDPKPDETPYV